MAAPPIGTALGFVAAHVKNTPLAHRVNRVPIVFHCTRCRFCAVDCEEYCANKDPEECECVQCEEGLELPDLPPPLSSTSSFTHTGEGREGPAETLSCADEEDGDAFCWEQVSCTNMYVSHLPCLYPSIRAFGTAGMSRPAPSYGCSIVPR